MSMSVAKLFGYEEDPPGPTTPERARASLLQAVRDIARILRAQGVKAATLYLESDSAERTLEVAALPGGHTHEMTERNGRRVAAWAEVDDLTVHASHLRTASGQ